MTEDNWPLSTAQAVKPAVLDVGSAFGRSDEFAGLVEQMGVGIWPVYFAGRAGVMGDVSAQTVAAVLGFFAPDHVVEALAASRAAGLPSEIARRDLEAMDLWGDDTFGGLSDLVYTLSLMERVVAGADPSGLALFAALRSQGGGTSPGGRLARALMCLREHRGGLYLLACRAVGLTPLEAVLAQGGPEKVEANGWRPPIPSLCNGHVELRREAEDLADRLVAPVFGVLTSAEADHLAENVQAIEPLVR